MRTGAARSTPRDGSCRVRWRRAGGHAFVPDRLIRERGDAFGQRKAPVVLLKQGEPGGGQPVAVLLETLTQTVGDVVDSVAELVR